MSGFSPTDPDSAISAAARAHDLEQLLARRRFRCHPSRVRADTCRRATVRSGRRPVRRTCTSRPTSGPASVARPAAPIQVITRNTSSRRSARSMSAACRARASTVASSVFNSRITRHWNRQSTTSVTHVAVRNRFMKSVLSMAGASTRLGGGHDDRRSDRQLRRRPVERERGTAKPGAAPLRRRDSDDEGRVPARIGESDPERSSA